MGLFSHIYAVTRNILKTKLSVRQKSALRLIRDITRSPKETKRHLNKIKYNKGLLSVSEIDFVPPVFVATIATNCNLRCPTCLYLLENKNTFFSSFMKPDWLRRILKNYNRDKTAETIFLTGGEPLLHPKIEEIIDICKDYNLSVKMSTNGILLKEKIDLFSKPNRVGVNISIDAYDYESFRRYRGGTKEQFDAIKDGLKALKDKGIYFSISFLLSKENLSGTDKMIDFARDTRPGLVFFHNINPHGTKRYTPLTIQDKESQGFLQKMLKRTDYSFNVDLPIIFDPSSPAFRKSKCMQPWNRFCFNSEGNVSFCCHLLHSRQIGNVFDGYNFNTREMVKFRKGIMEGEIPKSCLYCQRRFTDKGFAVFDPKVREWFTRYEAPISDL